MTDGTNPYANMSRERLMELKREAQSAANYQYKRSSKSRDREVKKSAWDESKRQQAIVEEIIAEFDRRHHARRPPEPPRPTRPSPVQPPPTDPAGDAFKRHFRSLRNDNPPQVKAASIEYIWQVGSLSYLGFFEPGTGQLSVWLEVKSGTPEAAEFHDKFYLPGNTIPEHNQAKSAEREARA